MKRKPLVPCEKCGVNRTSRHTEAACQKNAKIREIDQFAARLRAEGWVPCSESGKVIRSSAAPWRREITSYVTNQSGLLLVEETWTQPWALRIASPRQDGTRASATVRRMIIAFWATLLDLGLEEDLAALEATHAISGNKYAFAMLDGFSLEVRKRAIALFNEKLSSPNPPNKSLLWPS